MVVYHGVRLRKAGASWSSPRPTTTKAWEIEWVPVDDVPNRKLLTAMRTDWPNFAARLRALAAVR